MTETILIFGLIFIFGLCWISEIVQLVEQDYQFKYKDRNFYGMTAWTYTMSYSTMGFCSLVWGSFLMYLVLGGVFSLFSYFVSSIILGWAQLLLTGTLPTAELALVGMLITFMLAVSVATVYVGARLKYLCLEYAFPYIGDKAPVLADKVSEVTGKTVCQTSVAKKINSKWEAFKLAYKTHKEKNCPIVDTEY